MKKHLLLFAVSVFFCTFAVQAEEIVLPKFGFTAHRGENGVFPENTVIGFQEAVRLGAAQVEFDICRTKDGHIVIMHDNTVDRTTNGKGNVADMTFEEIRKLDAGIKKGERFAGTKVPTFEEALDCLPRNIWINVHVKNSPVEAAEMIIKKKREHQAFLACTRKAALLVKEKYPQIKICNMEREGGDVSKYISNTIAWKCDFIQLLKLGTPEEMKALKDAGVRINYTIAKDPEHYKELRKAGVDFPLVDKASKFVEAAKE
ncbi:MAG: glycerophosphodiester phosphodiesterase family protein [Planctomycetaceae bacterium]|nr:glycerophosphodiester phosphodiesterase family protein [Planctomycetaceae bacterium]